MSIFEAIIIAIVEGLTEFLPVSSTGHMIITQELLGMEITDFVKAFTVNIQFGAILAVVVLYWKRFFQSMKFYYTLFIAFIPAAVIGFLASDFIDQMLENVVVVAVMLVLGGIVLVFVDKWFQKPAKSQQISYPSAFKIGLYQCIAMIPGVSRSAATIIGGMTQNLDRKTAAEFSFFLAVPTMFAAAGYKLLQNYQSIEASHINILLLGNLVAFVVALIAIKTFISLLTRYGFKYFGYYRIIVGLIILVMVALGYELSVV
ncbi:MAG: Undecaprenyl-diphosphatase [Bacteroidetes bacterium]|jgi:undecaprenyl-diphosphatase|nr:MAG: Undecaprenyl-diphosphatase [Bacteroidota bacterium]